MKESKTINNNKQETSQSLKGELEKKKKKYELRRSIEDYLAEKALQRKLEDVFDDGYELL